MLRWLISVIVFHVFLSFSGLTREPKVNAMTWDRHPGYSCQARVWPRKNRWRI